MIIFVKGFKYVVLTVLNKNSKTGEKWKSLSRVRLFATPWNSPWNSPGQNTGVGSLFLLKGIFPTQGLNPGLPHCGRILYQLSHQSNSFQLVGSQCTERIFWGIGH